MFETKIERIRNRYECMKKEKSQFLEVANTLARYVLGRKDYIYEYETSGNNFFDPYIFDETAMNALQLMVSSLQGALWPNGAKSFKLILPNGLELQDTQEEKDYWDQVTIRLSQIMDNPKSGFLTSFQEYLTEQGVFGTSGEFVEETDDLDVPVIYRPINYRDLFIDVSPYGEVDTVYIRYNMTLKDIYKTYGPDALTLEEQKEMRDTKNNKKYEIVNAIEPRLEYDPDSKSNLDFPYSSCHVDITRDRLLKESGYKELPVYVGRFMHALSEKYGRSPGMIALPSIREINQLRYLLITAGEKLLYPPVNVIEGSIVGNDEVDLSPRGINVVSVSGKLGNYRGRPIEQTTDVNDPQWAFSRLTELIEIIKNHFYQDRLMDLNNEQRMTLGEANIRNQLRGQSLNPIYARQQKENLERKIERTFNIALGKGLLGVVKGSEEEATLLAQGITPFYIPDSVVDRMISGREVYKVQFVSPAMRIMQVEESSGIEQTLQFAIGVAQVDPTVMDNYDLDYTMKRAAELFGGPSKMVRAADTVAKIREQRQQQQEQAMQVQMMSENSNTAKNMASAQKDMEQAS